MSAVKKTVDKRLLKGLVPINALAPQHFNEIADKIIVEDLPAGRVIFKEGERDNRTVYLLAGEITLFSGASQVGSVYGDTESARQPLASSQPRQYTAKAKTPVTIARIDTGLLDVLMTWDQSAGYEVTELEDGDEDWMSRMLQSPTFQKLPAANIQKLLMIIEEYAAPSGSAVIKQGDLGDYYYIIKQGRCVVTRKASPAAQDVKLAELTVGDSFGEDALISDSKRNATITMLTDGRLMRLAKQDFVALLREPLLAQVSFAKAQSLVSEGAHWLDVRLPGEFQQDHITGAVNIPLSALRHRFEDLDTASRYIVYCDNGGRSSTAAFLLSQHGFTVQVLTGGTQALAPSEVRAAHGHENASVRSGGSEGGEVIDFNQQAQVRKAADESAVSQKEAQHAAEQLLVETRRQSEQILREAEQQAKQQVVIQSTLVAERDTALQKISELESAHQQLVAQHAQLQEALQREIERAKTQAATPALADPALAELRRELKAAQRDAQAAEQARQALTQELSSTLTNLKQLERAAEDQTAAEQNAALQDELDILRDQLHTAQREVTQAQQSMQEQLAARDEKIVAMKAGLESARQQVLDADNQKADLESARAAAHVRAEALQAELAKAEVLQVRLAAAEQQVAEQAAARQQLEQDVERLHQAQAQALTKAGQAQQTQQDVLQQQLAELQAQQARAIEQQQRLDDEHQVALTELRNTLEAREQAHAGQLEAQHAELAQAGTALQQARETHAEQLAKTATELSGLRANIADKERELAEQTAQLQAQLEQSRQEAAAGIKVLEERLAESRQAQSAEQGATAAQIAQLNEALADKSQAAEQAVAALTETSQQAEARVAELQARLAKAEQHTATVTEQQTALQSELQTAQLQREELQARIKTLQNDADAALSKTSEQAEARIAELQTQLAAAERNAKIETEQQRSAAAALQQELQVAQQAREALQSRIESLQQESAATLHKSGEQAEARITELQTQLASTAQDAQAETEQLRAASAALQQDLQTAQQQREELQVRIHTLQEEAESALTRTSKQAGERLAGELAKVRAELEAAEKSAQNEISTLRVTLQGEALARTQDGKRLADERSEWQTLSKALEDKLTQAERGRADAVATAQTVEQELERQRGEADATQQATRDEVAQARQEAEALRAELKQLGEQLNGALGESDAVDAAREQAENEIARLKARILELESATQSEDTRGGKSEKKHAAALSKLRAEMTAAETEAKLRYQELQSQLEQVLEQGHATETHFAQQQAQAKESGALLDQARRRAAELVQDVEDVKAQLEAQTQQRLAAETARKAAQQEADALRAESQIMSNLGGDHIEATAAQRVREQQTQIARLESELQETKKNVELAVRLRTESDTARQAFEQEIARLKDNVNAPDVVAAPGQQRRIAQGGAGLGLRSGLGLSLAAGWLVAVGLGAYLALFVGKTMPPAAMPAPVTAKVQSAPAVAPTRIAAAKPKAEPVVAVTRPETAALPKPDATQARTVVHALGNFRDNLRDGGSGPLLTRLPAGSYQMGSAANSLNFAETPRHEVDLKAFAIGSYEVTFADYDRFAAASGRSLPSDNGWGRDNRPVININWDDAVAYTHWLTEQTGHRYRLPSEAEWEYAAAAGASTFYAWGNNGGENHAVCFNCGSRWDGRQTAPIGSFPANAFGLYDMAGNVLEWVADCRHDSYQDAPGDGGVWAGGDCSRHMARGGAYDSPLDNLRTQSRPYFATATRLNNLGLRVVRQD